jgi:mono/diheme cytochrome c family protein
MSTGAGVIPRSLFFREMRMERKRIGIFLWAAGTALILMAGAALAAESEATAPSGVAEQGAKVFESNGCGFCHENGGKSAGKGPQLMATARDDSFITFRIKHGKEAKMPAFGSSLTDAQILDLIAYIRSLKE